MIKEPKGRVAVNYEYVDEYDNVTNLSKVVDADYLNETEQGVLLETFREFLGACGFYVADRHLELIED